jgi:hypothetical protein
MRITNTFLRVCGGKFKPFLFVVADAIIAGSPYFAMGNLS